MSDTVNTDTAPVAEVDIAGQIIKDPEIRKLPAGSEEYKAAVEKLTEKTVEEATADTEKKKSKSGLEKRFSELTSARDQEKARADQLERELNEVRSKAQSTKTESTPVEAEPEMEYNVPRPVVDSYSNYDEYVEALADWKYEKREFDKQQKVYLEEVKAKRNEKVSTWETREKQTKEKVQGYDQLVDQEFIQKFTGVKPSGHKGQGLASTEALTFLFESEVGPDILFELAEDNDKLEDFKGMTPVRQVAYLTKLEMSYEGTDKQTAKVSKAPPPPKSLPKGKVVSKTVDPFSGPVSFGDYQLWRKAQKK